MIRYIYTFFVGLFMAIFVGMGVAVFYPEPTAPEEPAVFQSIGKNGPTAEQQRKIDAYNSEQKVYERKMSEYNKYASIIVLICAVVILIIALSLNEKLGIIADGILLGGIFTLMYGIGRGIATDSNVYQFLIAGLGLATTLILGYIKFTHRRINNKNAAGNTTVSVMQVLAVIGLLAVAIYGTYYWQHQQVGRLESTVRELRDDLAKANKPDSLKPTMVTMYDYTSQKGVKAKVYIPAKGSQATDPIIIMGEIPGNWSFEASFPMKLVNSKGTVIAEGPAQLQGEWMTSNLVPFIGRLAHPSDVNGDATLVIQKDNPSGLSENDDSITIPIKL